jgi:xanthine dehydrogenase large subunit
LNGSAAVNACQKLKQTLSECAAAYFSSKEIGIGNYPDNIVFENGFVFDSRRPHNRLTFPDLVGMAYRERRSLGERGHYITKGIDFDWNVGQGNPFLYYTNGCAVSEVLIDRFTGQLKVERADLLMDVGKPINPGITRGQIIGAYVQGLGWASMEELKYTDKGALLAHSPTTYKIPNIHDVPPVLNVNIIENDTNTVNVRGTKAVGEPPFVLGISVWTAVKHALSFVSNGEIPRLTLPATNEQILSRLTHYQKNQSQSDSKQSKSPKKKDRAAALAP